jgi:hypothetical protein
MKQALIAAGLSDNYSTLPPSQQGQGGFIMPNWTYNDVTISGAVDKVKQIKTLLKGENGAFDFNTLIPMPESLDIESGSNNGLGMACFDSDKFRDLSTLPWVCR